MSEYAPVLLYDGVCALCNGAVKKILRDDKVGTMRFAALDSEYGDQVLARHPELVGVDSFVIVDNPGEPIERIHIRSDGVLRIMDYLGSTRRAAVIARLVPRPIRDALYRLVARTRYRVFGQYDTCPVPPPEVRARFLA
ncbi:MULTISPECIES: DCC1-like thiol-disulfide oxidoreductase family protein [unclassified Mycobacterium]|uniref:thiol-disulfide oxidoreductase DCC family protein n=1 Tax=unclassified Mycobacterium TaxID=2642494 RepID=UPI000991B3E4|nr:MULTISPECIES: DCC1-like thiol-disulfide oxidoreductase family protein [unclassified Mycobacterium]